MIGHRKWFQRLSPTGWATIQSIFEQVFSLLLFAVQAPLLGPAPFGLIALVMVFIGFCEVMLIEVAADVLISIREIDDKHFATMTAVNLLIASIIGALVFAGAGPLARMMDDPELQPVMHWMALLPLLASLYAAPTATTKRAMNFRPTTMRSIFSLSFSGAIGLGLAFAGAGVWALVAQALVQRLTGAIVLWTTIPLKFGLALSSRHLREIRVFAIPMLVGRSMNWGSAQIPRFILGSFLGVTDLGLYSLAARFRDILLQLAIVPRTSVARVELRAYATEPSGKVEGVKRLLFEMSAFCFPLSCGGAAIAPTLFHVWLDQRWHGAILPAQILLVACFPFVTLYCATSLLLALNEQRSVAFVSSIQTIASVLAVLAAAPFGLVVTSIAMAAGSLLALPITVFQVSRRCGVPIGATLGSQAPAFFAASAMGAAVAIAASPLESMFGAPIALPLLVGGGAVLYTLMMLVFAPEFALGTIRRLREAFRLRSARAQ